MRTNDKGDAMRTRVIVMSSLLLTLACANMSAAAQMSPEQAEGQALAFDSSKGNCLACHAIPGDPEAQSPGNIGPALVKLRERYPDRAKLRAQIWDTSASNPNTIMPPFGRNKVLTEQEIDRITDYLLAL